jgi:hypothetical protein
MQAPAWCVRLTARALVLAITSLPLAAQAQEPPSHWEFVNVSSGNHDNPTPVEGVVWSGFVSLPNGTPWLRLHYANANLDKGSYLRITSVLDGHSMLQHQEHLPQWSYTSCYFNGDAVLVELIAGPNTTGNAVDIRRVKAGDLDPSVLPETICGSQDNRIPSSDARSGRIDPIGCSAWIINTPGNNKLHLSAGHCVATGQVLQFAVPASGSNCALVFPPPAKQFAIDTGTDQSANTGIGNDWWVFRCFPNSTTGLTTFQEQGAAFTLAAALPANGTTLRNWGYGLDGTNVNNATATGSCSCPSTSTTGTRNQTQQTHTGQLFSVSGNRVNHQIDTCGGNSGSVLINDGTGQAIAIHTNGGCTTSTSSSNSGTSVLNTSLQAAITAVTPPVIGNDECTGQIHLDLGLNGPYTTVGATNSSPAFPCGLNVGKDIWFHMHALATGTYTFTTCTPTRNFDTVIQVFDGACAGPSVGCNDDTGGACGLGSTLTLNLNAGVYYVRVGGYNGAQGNFDLVITPTLIYDAGPIITSATGGSGGAPLSVVQTAAPYNLGIFGFNAAQTATTDFSLADDFATNGPWTLNAIELPVYQTTTLTPSITGVFVEVYNGDPSAGGVPVAGSPGFANNLMSVALVGVDNTMTGAFRALDTAPTDGNRPLQSVFISLINPINLNSATIAGGRYWLRYKFTGSGTSGPFVPPITVLNSAATGNAIQSNTAGTWSPILSGGVGQGIPFKLYGGSSSLPRAITNLGGGCTTATLEIRGEPHVGGVIHIEMLNWAPSSVPLILIGITNPNLLFPSCGCVQQAALDVVHVGSSYTWQVPMLPYAVGFEFYTQGDQVEVPGSTMPCDLGVGFTFGLTDGYRVRFW